MPLRSGADGPQMAAKRADRPGFEAMSALATPAVVGEAFVRFRTTIKFGFLASTAAPTRHLLSWRGGHFQLLGSYKTAPDSFFRGTAHHDTWPVYGGPVRL